MVQRIFFDAIFRCDYCGHRDYIWRRSLFVIFQRYSECPRCGTHDLSRLSSRDWVDSTTQNPLRRTLGLFGFPLYHCTFCRLQFWDWRKRESDVSKRSAA